MASKVKSPLDIVREHAAKFGQPEWHPLQGATDLYFRSRGVRRKDEATLPKADPNRELAALRLITAYVVPKLAAVVISNDPENPGAAAEQAKAMLLAMVEPTDPKPARKPKPRAQHRREAAEAKAKEPKIH